MDLDHGGGAEIPVGGTMLSMMSMNIRGTGTAWKKIYRTATPRPSLGFALAYNSGGQQIRGR